jgi:hypothetical protein
MKVSTRALLTYLANQFHDDALMFELLVAVHAHLNLRVRAQWWTACAPAN